MSDPETVTQAEYKDAHYRFDLLSHDQTARRTASLIANTSNDELKSLPKEKRRWVGKQVARLIRQWGWEDLTAVSTATPAFLDKQK